MHSRRMCPGPPRTTPDRRFCRRGAGEPVSGVPCLPGAGLTQMFLREGRGVGEGLGGGGETAGEEVPDVSHTGGHVQAGGYGALCQPGCQPDGVAEHDFPLPDLNEYGR
jgi:hypothetical protein